MQRKLQLIGYVLVAFVAGGLGSAAQTVVFQKAKFLATSTAADAIQSKGGITAGSGNVGIVSPAGKIPALTSTYINSLSFDSTNLTGTSAAINGSNITSLNASNIASGTLSSARLGTIFTSATTQTDGSYTAAHDIFLVIAVISSGEGDVTVGGRYVECNGNGVSSNGCSMFIFKGESYTLHSNSNATFHIGYLGS